MPDERHGRKAALSADGVHPSAAGYALSPLVEAGIEQAPGMRED